jgi:hypothetical protein
LPDLFAFNVHRNLEAGIITISVFTRNRLYAEVAYLTSYNFTSLALSLWMSVSTFGTPAVDLPGYGLLFLKERLMAGKEKEHKSVHRA